MIIEACLRDESARTCYFYCNENDPEKNNCTAVFKGLVSQLLCDCRELIPYCHEKRLSSGEINLVSASLAKQLLELLAHRLPRVFVIVDGLDECPPVERKLIASTFTTLVEKCDEYSPGKLRVLCVSQDFPDIQKALLTASLMSISEKENEHDLKMYTQRRCYELKRKYDLLELQVKDVLERTVAKARGKHPIFC